MEETLSTCDDQVLSHNNGLVHIALTTTASSSNNTTTTSLANNLSGVTNNTNNVTTMLWQPEGILRHALINHPELINFTTDDDDDKEETQKTISLIALKPNETLTSISQLPDSNTTNTDRNGSNNDEDLLAQQSTSSNNANNSIETTLLSVDTFNGAIPQFSYKLSNSPELLEPLPPISEVHKAAAVAAADQLLNNLDNRNHKTLNSFINNEITNTLLLSGEPLTAMSSSQVSSLLSALNPETTTNSDKELSDLEFSPARKLLEHLGLSNKSIETSPNLLLQNKSSDHDITITVEKLNYSTVARRLLIEQDHHISEDETIKLEDLPLTNSMMKLKAENLKETNNSNIHQDQLKTAKKKCNNKTKKLEGEFVSCYTCMFCPFLSLDKNGLDQHISSEHSEETTKFSYCTENPGKELKCPGCPNIFFSIQSLQVHLLQDHRAKESDIERIVHCLCPNTEVKKTVKKRTNKTKELSNCIVVTDERGILSLKPIAECDRKEELEKNQEDDEEEEDDDNDSQVLNNSDVPKKRGRPRGSKSTGITALKKQNPNLRLGEKELGYVCSIDFCAVRLRSQDNIEYHRKCHNKETGVFICPECTDFTNIQWRNLTWHLWKSHGIDMELYSCDQCSYKTNSYSKLINLHKRIHGDERPFLCDTCGKGFKTNKQLRNHKTIHNANAKPRVPISGECDICFRKFVDKRLLRIHIDTVHEKIRPYLCNYCGYSASSRSTLKMHMRQHTGEKPFACNECEYKTADHNSMRRHKMRHSGQKKYQCPHCDYGCIQSSTYKSHLKTKHPGQDDGILFSCQYCSFKTIKRATYTTHLSEHQHKEEDEQLPSTSNNIPTSTIIIKSEIIHPTAELLLANDVMLNNHIQDNNVVKKRSKIKHINPNNKLVKKVKSNNISTNNKISPDEFLFKLPNHTSNKINANNIASSSKTLVPNPTLEFDNVTSELELIPPMKYAELKIADIDCVPVVTVLDGTNKLMQITASDFVPISLSPAQASALQFSVGDTEEISEDITSSQDNQDIKFISDN